MSSHSLSTTANHCETTQTDLPLLKRKTPVLSMSSDLKCKGLSFAAGKVGMSNPWVDATSLTAGHGHCNRP